MTSDRGLSRCLVLHPDPTVVGNALTCVRRGPHYEHDDVLGRRWYEYRATYVEQPPVAPPVNAALPTGLVSVYAPNGPLIGTTTVHHMHLRGAPNKGDVLVERARDYVVLILGVRRASVGIRLVTGTPPGNALGRALAATTTDAEFSAVLLTVPWFVVANDLVGGWSVATVNRPTSELPSANGGRWLFDALTRELAEHVVGLHNRYLRQRDEDRSGTTKEESRES